MRFRLAKIKNLPESTLPEGGGPGVVALCRECGNTYSATRGDYFMMAPDDVLKCCGEPNVLAQLHSEYRAARRQNEVA